jgi:hypothetical protein
MGCLPSYGDPPPHAREVFQQMCIYIYIYMYTHIHMRSLRSFFSKTSHTYMHTHMGRLPNPIHTIERTKHNVFACRQDLLQLCRPGVTVLAHTRSFAKPTPIHPSPWAESERTWCMSAKQACMGSMLKSLTARPRCHQSTNQGVSSKLYQSFGGSVCGPRARYYARAGPPHQRVMVYNYPSIKSKPQLMLT